jgi:hypothetical protein
MATESQNKGLEVEIGVTLNKLTKQLAAAEARMVGTAKRSEQQWQKSNARAVKSFDAVAKSSKRAAGGVGTDARYMAMQLSQVGQQYAAGGDIVRALAIQLPDLTLGFGAVGIAAGVAAGALLPLAVNMLKSEDAAKDLETTMSDLDAAMSRLESSTANSGQGLSALQQKYRGMAEQAQRFFEIEREIAAIRAGEALNAASRSIAGELDVGGTLGLDPAQIRNASSEIKTLKAEIADLQAQTNLSDEQLRAVVDRIAEAQSELSALREVNRNFDDLADILGITESQAQEVAARFAEIEQTEGARAQADAMLALVEYISDASDNLADAEDEGKALYDQLLDAAAQGLILAGLDLAGPIGAGADEAKRLADNLRLAELAYEFSPGGRAMSKYGGRGTTSDTEITDGRGYILKDGKFVDPDAKPTGRGGSGGTSAAEKAQNELLRERDRILKSLATDTEKVQEEIDTLNRVMAAGQLTSEQYDQAMQRLNERMVDAKFGDMISAIDDFSKSIADAIVNGENLGDVMINVIKRIAAEALASRISDIFTGGLTGGGGGGFGGGLLSFIFGKRASGGPLVAGRPTLVGENGPELMIPGNGGGRIMNAQQTQRALTRTPERVEVVSRVEGGDLTLTDDGKIAANIRVSSSQARQGAVSDVRRGFGQISNEYQRSGGLVR